MERGQPFLSSGELADKVPGWRRAADFETDEDGRYEYPATRTDRKITELYGESVVEGVIPRMLALKKGDEKVCMLDIGGGAGVLAEQVRQAFGDRVKVYTTGMRKKPARAVRREEHEIDETLSNGLRKDDLKWRSVLELHNYPEFDFIQDTYGEAYHGVRASEELRVYFNAVCDKLLSGGEARLIVLPVSIMGNDNPEQKVKNFIQEIAEQKHVDVSFEAFKKEKFPEIIIRVKKNDV